MEQYICAVMASRFELKELAIQGVRKPGHGMPIGLIVAGESPLDRVPVESGLNVDIFRDVGVVVVIDEWVMRRRVVERDGGDDQEKTKNKYSLRWSCKPTRPRLRRSPLLGFCTKMLGFQTSRSHSSPICDEYIRWAFLMRLESRFGDTLGRSHWQYVL